MPVTAVMLMPGATMHEKQCCSSNTNHVGMICASSKATRVKIDHSEKNRLKANETPHHVLFAQCHTIYVYMLCPLLQNSRAIFANKMILSLGRSFTNTSLNDTAHSLLENTRNVIVQLDIRRSTRRLRLPAVHLVQD